MRQDFQFSDILSPKELKILETPHEWRWVSTMAKPDLRPIRFPRYEKWAEKHAHAPPQREIFLTLSGKCLFLLGNKVYRTTPGVVMMFNRQERHDRDLAPWNKDFRHLWLHSTTSHAVSSNINAIDARGVQTNIPLKLISGHNPKLLMGLWNLCGSSAIFSPIHWAFLKSVIATCLFESVSDWQHPASTRPHELIVKSVCEHIQKNLDKELTLESLSRFAGYSPYFLHRIFRRHTGMPLHRHIMEVRLERAKTLLTEGMTVSAVSEQIGMPSPSYFSRFFKRHTNLTPHWWSEAHQVQK